MRPVHLEPMPQRTGNGCDSKGPTTGGRQGLLEVGCQTFRCKVTRHPGSLQTMQRENMAERNLAVYTWHGHAGIGPILTPTLKAHEV